MNPTAASFVALSLALAVGLVTWAVFVMTRIDAQLRGFDGVDGFGDFDSFEAQDFEVEPRVAALADGAARRSP